MNANVAMSAFTFANQLFSLSEIDKQLFICAFKAAEANNALGTFTFVPPAPIQHAFDYVQPAFAPAPDQPALAPVQSNGKTLRHCAYPGCECEFHSAFSGPDNTVRCNKHIGMGFPPRETPAPVLAHVPLTLTLHKCCKCGSEFTSTYKGDAPMCSDCFVPNWADADDDDVPASVVDEAPASVQSNGKKLRHCAYPGCKCEFYSAFSGPNKTVRCNTHKGMGF